MSADTPPPSDADESSSSAPEQPDGLAEDPAGLLKRSLSSAGSDALRYVPARFVPALATLLSVPVFTALISPHDYGAFFLVSSVLTLASNIVVGWIGSATVRYYWPLERDGRTDAFTSTIVWGSLTALVTTALVGGAAAWFARAAVGPDVWHLVPMALVFFVLNYLTDILTGVLRAAKQAAMFAKLQVAGAMLSTVLSIACVWLGKLGAAGIFAGGALAWLLLLFPMLRAVSELGSTSPRAASVELMGEFWTFGMPLVPVYMASWVLVLIDRFVIQAYLGSTQVGLYSVAYNLGDRFMQLATVPLMLTMVPSLIEAFEHHGQGLAERVQTQFVRYFALVTFPVVAGLLAAGQSFMRVFTTTTYATAWPVVSIVAAGTMCSAFAQIATTGLTIHHRTKIIMQNSLVAAAFNFVANIALVPRFGYIAAAYNTLLAYLLMMVLAWWRSRDTMPLHIPWANLSRVVAAAVGMGLAVWLPFLGHLPAGRIAALGVLAVQAVVGVVVYVALVIAVRAVRRDEMAALVDVGRKMLGIGSAK